MHLVELPAACGSFVYKAHRQLEQINSQLRHQKLNNSMIAAHCPGNSSSVCKFALLPARGNFYRAKENKIKTNFKGYFGFDKNICSD